MYKCTTVALLLLAFVLSACSVNVNLGSNASPTTDASQLIAPTSVVRATISRAEDKPAAIVLPSAMPEPTTELKAGQPMPAGFKSYTNQEAGFTIALPSDWNAIPFDSETLNAGMDKLRESQPELVQAIDPQVRSLIQSGVIKFFAGKPADGTAIRGNLLVSMNIARQPIPASVTIDQFMEASIKTLKALPQSAGAITPEPVTLPAGDARRIQYSLNLNGPDGTPITVTITQYMLVYDSAAYILSFQAEKETAQQQAATFEQIAQSFEIRS